MSYICTSCGHITEVLPKVIEKHPVGDGYAEEEVSSWICDCGGVIDSAAICQICGETKSEEDNLFYGDFCEDCLKEAAKDFDLVKKCSDKLEAKTTVEIDSLAQILLGDRDINEILWNIINASYEGVFGAESKKQDALKAEKWAREDLDWFSDAISEVSEFG